MAAQRLAFVTPEEYLAQERRNAFKSEYHGGEIVAMSGVSKEHDRIVTTLLIWLGQRLSGTLCEPFSADIRVRPTSTHYYFPT